MPGHGLPLPPPAVRSQVLGEELGELPGDLWDVLRLVVQVDVRGAGDEVEFLGLLGLVVGVLAVVKWSARRR